MAEPTTSTTVAGAAACTAAATWICVAQDAAVQLLGVPLSVVLAGLTGALLARYFMPVAGFWAALASASVWTTASAFMVELVRWILQWASDKPVPAGALAGLALITGAVGPRMLQVVIERGPAALARVLDSIKGGPSGG